MEMKTNGMETEEGGERGKKGEGGKSVGFLSSLCTVDLHVTATKRVERMYIGTVEQAA